MRQPCIIGPEWVRYHSGMDVPHGVWHCLESDVVANQQDPPRFPAVLLIGQTQSVALVALLDVVVVSCPMEELYHHVQQCHTTAASQGVPNMTDGVSPWITKWFSCLPRSLPLSRRRAATDFSSSHAPGKELDDKKGRDERPHLASPEPPYKSDPMDISNVRSGERNRNGRRETR